jgi:hypothetical protein
MPTSPRLGSASPRATMCYVAAAVGAGSRVPAAAGFVGAGCVGWIVSAKCLCYCLGGSVAADDEV